jgi:outer membrane receptor for ferrienterochelin and colicins
MSIAITHAQHTEVSNIDTLAEHTHIIHEVVVTGQYAAISNANAVQKIKVIDRKAIDAMSAQNLRDVLANELNIRLSQDDILGSSLSFQGISGENVKILIDGVPVIGRQNGNIDLSQINLNNVEHIEIVEGPMSVNYGTNALAGTINLITKKQQRSLVETNLSSYYESIGTYNLNIKLGVHKNKHTISVTGCRNFFDGWSNSDKFSLDFKPHIADSTRFQQWKPREQYQGAIQYSYKTGNTTIHYKCDYFNEKIINRGLPNLPYNETAFDDYYYTTRIDNALFINSLLHQNKVLNFQIAYNAYNRTKNTYYNDLTTLVKTLSANDGDQDTSKFHSVNSRATYATCKADTKVNYEAGYDINIEDATGVRIKDNKKQIGDYACFVSMEYTPTQLLTIRPGVRYAYNTSYTAPIIPSVNVRYKLFNNLILRSSYSKGFRSPSLKELYFYFVDINHNIKGNEELKAEYSDNYALSAVYSKNKAHFNYKVDVAAYYNYILNLITLAQTTGAEYSYINIGKYKTKGVQLNGEVGTKNIRWSIGMAYMGTYNALSETQNITSFSYSPELHSSLFYELKKYEMTIALFYKYTGRLPGYATDANNNTQQTFIAAYHTADISLSKLLFQKRVNISFGCKNLFDVKNVTAYAAGGVHTSADANVPMSCGRLYFIKMDLNFKK